MRLPEAAHTDRAWRIHAIAPDFDLYDVLALPTPGRADDFPRLVQLFAGGDTHDTPSWLARTLFAVREKAGALLGWDSNETGVGSPVPTLRDALPADLRAGPTGPEFASLPFRPLYLTDDEWVAEMTNRTVHALLHLSWVPAPGGGYRGQMAALVKPNGLLGRAYLAGITPFRHLIVYPAVMRDIDQDWRRSATARPHP